MSQSEFGFSTDSCREQDHQFDAEVVDTRGNRYLRLSGYRTVTLPDIIDAEPLRALQRVTA
jgi:hypothetical protein